MYKYKAGSRTFELPITDAPRKDVSLRPTILQGAKIWQRMLENVAKNLGIMKRPRKHAKINTENMSPYGRGHCKNLEGCLHKAEAIARILKDVSLGLTPLRVAG